MASAADHLNRADAIEKLADSQSSLGDWEIVRRFYAGVHCIEAYLVTFYGPSDGHKTRNMRVRTDAHLRTVRIKWVQLYNAAWDTRYTPLFVPPPSLIKSARTTQKSVCALVRKLLPKGGRP